MTSSRRSYSDRWWRHAVHGRKQNYYWSSRINDPNTPQWSVSLMLSRHRKARDRKSQTGSRSPEVTQRFSWHDYCRWWISSHWHKLNVKPADKNKFLKIVFFCYVLSEMVVSGAGFPAIMRLERTLFMFNSNNNNNRCNSRHLHSNCSFRHVVWQLLAVARFLLQPQLSRRWNFSPIVKFVQVVGNNTIFVSNNLFVQNTTRKTWPVNQSIGQPVRRSSRELR